MPFNRRSSWITVLLFLVAACCPALAASPEESILITEDQDAFGITVPLSRLAIRLPKGGFERKSPPIAKEATANPRYFLFEDKARGLLLSGWFEPASRFPGVNKPAAINLGSIILQPVSISFGRIGEWQAVSYEMAAEGVSIANLTVHLVHADTWVELHLSGQPQGPLGEQHAMLAGIISSIQFQQKQ